MIYEQCPSLDLSDAQTLDLPNCGVRSVDLSPFDLLHNLARYDALAPATTLTNLCGLGGSSYS